MKNPKIARPRAIVFCLIFPQLKPTQFAKFTPLRPVTQGGLGGSEEPSKKVRSTDRTFFIIVFRIIFVSEPFCSRSVFTARTGKIAGFGSIFPTFFRGSMPPTPLAGFWLCPSTFWTTWTQQEPSHLNSLRTAMPLLLEFQVSRQACSWNVHVHVFRSEPCCTMATPLETQTKFVYFRVVRIWCFNPMNCAKKETKAPTGWNCSYEFLYPCLCRAMYNNYFFYYFFQYFPFTVHTKCVNPTIITLINLWRSRS